MMLLQKISPFFSFCGQSPYLTSVHLKSTNFCSAPEGKRINAPAGEKAISPPSLSIVNLKKNKEVNGKVCGYLEILQGNNSHSTRKQVPVSLSVRL